MSAFESREELVAKIEWEGGLDEAFSYGIQAKDMPDPELAAAWADAATAWDAFQTALNVVEEMLDEYME